jgi:serine/threonine-protein kinase ATR
LHNKPQKAQFLSDLTEQSVPSLLLATQTEILPHLVLTKRKDIIQRIATARQTSIQDVLIQPRKNLAGILALLICQPVADVETTTMDILLAIAPALQGNNRTLSHWVKLDPTLIACEILGAAADQHPSRREQVSVLPISFVRCMLIYSVSTGLRHTGCTCRYERWSAQDNDKEESFAVLF